MSKLAPVAVFVYKRPEHSLRLLQALARNNSYMASPIYIYCDAPRTNNDVEAVTETRRIIRENIGPNAAIIERKENMGLANSIIDGVSQLTKEFGRVIVLEDDLLVSHYFLDYMNSALDKYVDADEVMQISGYMFPANVAMQTDAHFMPLTTSWGWATWGRAWRKFDPDMKDYEKISKDSKIKNKFNMEGAYDYFNLLKLQRSGKIDSWAIRWYLNVFMENGLTLYPAKTLVENHGLDGSGTHCGDEDPFGAHIDPAFSVKRWPLEVKISENWIKVATFIRESNAYGHGIKSSLKRLLKKFAS